MDYGRKSYVVKGNKIIKPLPPIGYCNIDDKTDNYFQSLVRGCIDIDEIVKTKPREVRIFLSSTFTDFKVERNAFVKQVLPELRSICNAYGLNLRLCDMRWGITDSAVNEHLVEKLCVKEIETCRKTSIGPFFVLLMGNRYGYQPVPNELPSSEFEMLYKIISENFPKEASVFSKWFLKDENAQPPVHILLPIKTHIPTYADFEDEVKRRESGHEWWRVEESIRRCLKKACKIACTNQIITNERRNRLIRSVTETELWSAVMGPNLVIDKVEATRCLAYERQLNGLMNDLQSEASVKYIDYVTRDDQITCEASSQKALLEFKKSIQQIGLRQFRKFVVPWVSTGVTVDLISHKAYLEEFTKVVIRDIKELITQQMKTIINSSSRFDKTKTNLQTEIVHHWLFCNEQSKHFCGRLVQLETAIKLISNNYNCPIIVHGSSGCGKTAFLAKLAFILQQFSLSLSNSIKSYDTSFINCFREKQSPVIVLRFIGTSPSTTTIQQLLFSVCLQIQLAYGLRVKFKKMKSLSALQWFFNYLLQYVSRRFTQQMPLVIILDSLGQMQKTTTFESDEKQISFSWIPTDLPSGVHLIISIVTDIFSIPSYQILNDRLTNLTSQFIHIDHFDHEEMLSVFQMLQQNYRRKLTDQQMSLVLSKLLSNPQPLYIKVILEQTLSWTSFLPESEWIISDTIELAMDHVFMKLENKFGRILISKSLAYLTLGQNGLSETEIEDLLSLCDDVLNDVYEYHDPPSKEIVRLPSLLWTHIYADLSGYIVENNIDEKINLSWYHTVIHQCAFNRYVKDSQSYKQLHSEIAKYFSINEDYKEPCILYKRKLKIDNADRLLNCNPISDKEPRKLHALPFHLIESSQDNILITLCVTNLKFLMSYAACFGIQELILWLVTCENVFPSNETISVIRNCVTFVEPFLQNNINDLPIQLLGQLNHLNRLVSGTIPLQMISSLKSLCDESKAISYNLTPSVACFPSSLGPMKMYKEKINRVFQLSNNPSYIVLIGHHDVGWIVRLIQLTEMVTIFSINMEDKPISVNVPSQNQNYIFILDCHNFYIYDTDTNQLEGKQSLFLKKMVLNECMTVNHNGKHIAVAAQNHIAIFEQRIVNLDRDSITCKWILAAREVDTTLAMCFSQSEVHSLLVTCHTYNSKTQKTFIIKVWQFEQNNELWSVDLQTLPHYYGNFIYLWPFPFLKEEKIPKEKIHSNSSKESLLIILPNGMCYFTNDLLDHRILRLLTENESSKPHRSKFLSLSTDGEIVTLIRKIENETVIQKLDRTGNISTIDIPGQISPNLITSASINNSLNSLLIGVKSGMIYYISNEDFLSWAAHRERIDYLALCQSAETKWETDIPINIFTFSHTERVVKCWMKIINSSTKLENLSESIFVKMNSCAFSSCNNTFAVLDETCSVIHNGTIDNIESEIKMIMLDSDNRKISHETENFTVLDLEIVLQDQAVLIFYENKIKLFNLSNGQLWSNLDVNSKHTANETDIKGKFYWKCLFGRNELLILTFKKLTGYFTLDCHILPSFQNLRWSKRFLPPVNCVNPQIQLEKIISATNTNQNFLILQWKNCKIDADKDINQNKQSVNFMSLNLQDQSTTLCLIPCFNQEEAKKISVKNIISKTTNQSAFSYAIPENVLVNHTNDFLLTSTILLGGFGEILIWDMETGSCRLPKIPNFQTWFKHSMITSVYLEADTESEKKTSSDYKSQKSVTRSTINTHQIRKSPITALLITEGCLLVISGCGYGFIVIWKLAETIALNFSEPDCINNFRFVLAARHNGKVTCLTVDSPQRLLASGSIGMEIFLSNITVNQCLQKISVHCCPTSLKICYQKNIGDEASGTLKPFLICKAAHTGQNRMLIFDIIDIQ